MSPELLYYNLFRHVLVREVEYSYSDAEDSFTTMFPLRHDLLPRLASLAGRIPFAGDWAWSVERFWRAVNPSAFLFRLDWASGEATAVTLYCRFPSEPDTADFRKAIGHARPFGWNGPDPSGVAESLGVPGPRGIAFRASRSGRLRTSLYFRSEQHVGEAWIERLAHLLEVCQYSDELAPKVQRDLKSLYQPGPIGVIGIDDGEAGVPGTVKFDPSNVPVPDTFAFLASKGVSEARMAALRGIFVGLRAECATYVSAQYSQHGLAGWRVYFACEPPWASAPGRIALTAQRNLRPVRRLPHH